MKSEVKKDMNFIEKRDNSNAFYNNETGLTPKGKVLLGAGVFVAMALFAVLAGQNIGEDLGEFIYNISH